MFAHLNCRSICNKTELIQQHIQALNLEVFTLSETWLNESLPSTMFAVKGYNFVRLDRNWKSTGQANTTKGGGVAVFVKENISVSVNEYSRHNIRCETAEVLWVSINQQNMRKTVIGTIYRPPQGDVKEFVKILNENIIDILGSKHLELYIMGDFNIDYRSSPNKTLLQDLEANTYVRLLTKLPGTVVIIIAQLILFSQTRIIL